MLSSASRQFRHVGRRAIARRSFTTTSRAAGATSSMHWMAGGAAVVTVAAATMSIERTSLDAPPSTPAPIEEKKTGILFPATEGTLKFVGCGVRVKYGFVKVSILLRCTACMWVMTPIIILANLLVYG